MQAFFPTLISVLTLLAMASSGFLLKKTNMVSESCIPGFSKVLLYVCQPCLIVYTFASAEFSLEMLCNFGIFFLMLLTVHILMLGGAFLILKRRFGESVYRVITVATTFANCAFFGIPVIEALMPEIASQVVIYTSIYGAFMNIVGWTVGISIISGDKKYISPKKMLLNPAMAGLAVALVMYCLRLPLPKELIGAVTNTGRMATPLSMIIMGMRLATMELKPMFSDFKIYLTVAVKHIVMSLVAFSIHCGKTWWCSLPACVSFECSCGGYSGNAC
jgi:predicted permease